MGSDACLNLEPFPRTPEVRTLLEIILISCSIFTRPKDLALDWKVLKFIQNFLHSEIRYLVPK